MTVLCHLIVNELKFDQRYQTAVVSNASGSSWVAGAEFNHSQNHGDNGADQLTSFLNLMAACRQDLIQLPSFLGSSINTPASSSARQLSSADFSHPCTIGNGQAVETASSVFPNQLKYCRQASFNHAAPGLVAKCSRIFCAQKLFDAPTPTRCPRPFSSSLSRSVPRRKASRLCSNQYAS